MKRYFLAPSDFAWLLDECPRCWWLKLRQLYRPRESQPAVFRHIDAGQKEAYNVEALRSFGIDAKAIVPKGRLLSLPIEFEEYGVSFSIKGYLDEFVELDDGTHLILDFKTTVPTEKTLTKFANQLHAYATALERPAEGQPFEVSALGLLTFDPSVGKFTRNGSGWCAQTGHEAYLPIDLDRTRFFEFLDQCASLAASDDVPASGSLCQTCIHAFEVNRMLSHLAARRLALTPSEAVA